MNHRRLSALALIATGALAITALTTPPTFAADADQAESSSTSEEASDYQATVIVRLDEGIVGQDRAAAYRDVKARIAEAVAQASPGATIEDVRDYHHAVDGFAIKAPASTLASIKSVRGVADAFMERYREPVFYPEMSVAADAPIADPAKETRADQVAGSGRGRVIEVIDASFDTSNEAFAGSMDAASLHLTKGESASLSSQLDAGRGGAWVSDKIPFAYDYADGDTDLSRGYDYGPEDYTLHAHGTRMAALAAANGATYRGAAPQAQLVVAKVVSNRASGARDSDLLAALDDAMVIKPDVVSVAFMADRDLSGNASALYEQVFERLADAGVSVDAPAGDSGRSEWRANERDLGAVGAPGSYSSVLAVAAVGAVAGGGQEGYKPLAASSWGPTPDMRLKPEIAAPGWDVRAPVPGNEVRDLDGTGEASAQVAGAAALVRQRLAADPMTAAMSEAERSALVTNFLMGTAHPIVDADAKDGAYWSPRWVGAGMVDALAATTSSVYPAVVGAANPSRPKAELGESTSGWTFQVQLTNLSDTAHTYTLGGQALSESISGSLYTRHSTNWTGKGIDLTFSEGSVTVPAASSATVTVTVNPRAEFTSFATKQTPNGTFVDGAVTFTSADGQPDLTVPYLGFYGAVTNTPIFDSPVYGKETIGTSAMTFHGLTLGQLNPFDPEEEIAISTNDRDLYIISRSTDEYARTYATPGTVLLRDVVSLTYTYTNEAGEVVRSYKYGGAPKSRSYSNGRYYEVTTAEQTFDKAPLFDGYDANGNELPDGNYTLTIEGTTGGASPVTEKLTHVITLDTAPPVISNVAISGEGDGRTLSFDATDASPFPGFGFSRTQDGEPFMLEKYYGWGEIGADGLHHVHFEVPLSQIAERAGGDPSSVYLQVWDWPVNRASVKVDLTAIPMTKLSVSPEAATLSVGQSVTLSASHEPADASVTDVVWSSSNEAVATVSQDGVVSAVGAGEATVSVTDPTQPSLVSASATIRVEAPAPAPKTGAWKRDGRGWWYRYEDGSYPSSETLVIDGATYRFDASGYMRTGWVFDGGQWYFHAASGAQASGWVLSGVHWYYLNPDGGAMMTGWVQVGSTWYYLSPSGGAMATGWLKEGGHWYYLHHGSGAMATGWVRIYLKWYHFAENGQLIG